jgi:predicted transport protein
MKIIELSPKPPSMTTILEAVQDDDVLLVRAGHPLVRLEKFDDEDWEDWKYEHSNEAIARGHAARRQYRRGEFRPLNRHGESNCSSKASTPIRSLFERYEAAIRKFAPRDVVTRCPTDKGFSFFVNGRRFATITIRPRNLKIWLKLTPGMLKDSRRRAHTTKKASTGQGVRCDDDFDYILGLIKQAYLENK